MRNRTTRSRSKGAAQGKTWAALVLLALVVLIPAMTVGWLVQQASSDKRLAMEKVYEDARTGYLETGRNVFSDELASIRDRYARLLSEAPPGRRWGVVFASGRGDGYALVGITSEPTLGSEERVATEVKAEEIEEELEGIRDLVRSGSSTEAEQRIEVLLNDPDLIRARMPDGRSVALMVAFLSTELATEPEAQTAARTRLRSMVLDEEMQALMPVSQLLFFLGRIRPWGEDTEIEAIYRFARNSVAWTENQVPGEGENLIQPIVRRKNLIGFQVNPGLGTVLLEEQHLVDRVQHRLDLLEERAGGRLVLKQMTEDSPVVPDDTASIENPVLVETGFPLEDWVIAFVGEDRDTVMGRADREALWLAIVGALVIAISISLSLALFKVMQRQAKLAQLKNDLVATVSHELKTPVASIRLLVDTLQSDQTLDPVRIRDYLGLITRENNRLGHLIENFLSFSRMERNKDSFDLKPVGPAGIAREAEKTFHERRADWHGRLTLNIEDGLPPIQADHDALQTAIGNLLENARKYGGDQPDITLAARRIDHVIEFSVTDHGIGISREDQRQIFEKFFQARTRLSAHSGGVGLGLSIVSFIVEKHRGELVLESNPGRGSVFTIRIPLAGSPGPA